jgi:hypothetical protein
VSESRPNSIRDQLVALEATSPSLRERYETNVRALLERRLSPFQRTCAWLSLLVNMLLAAGLLARAGWDGSLFVPADYWVLLATAVVGLIGSSAWSGYLLWRGSIHRLGQEPWFEALGLIVTGAMAAALLWLARQVDDLASTLQVTAVALILLGIVGVVTLWSVQRRHHLETKVKLLELELRLAELAERLDKSKS